MEVEIRINKAVLNVAGRIEPHGAFNPSIILLGGIALAEIFVLTLDA
jgi:hypothetical protein